ncbi:hypothetical protein ACFQV8_30710 [Pseudonocardia benzenivorans]
MSPTTRRQVDLTVAARAVLEVRGDPGEPGAAPLPDALPLLDLDRELTARAGQPPDEQAVTIDVGEMDPRLPNRREQVPTTFAAGQHLVGDTVDVEVDVLLRGLDVSGLLLLLLALDRQG